MKPKSILTALAVALLAPGALFAQTTATTTPVGYITNTIAGAGTGSAAFTYLAPTLIQPTEFVAQSTASPSDTDTITFSGGVPAGLDGAYVLEITSGPSAGWWSTVVSSTSTTITVFDDFPTGLGANTPISVRKHATLVNFLGFNSPGFVTFNGIDASDEVQIFDPITQSGTPYAFVTGDDLGDPEYPNGAWLNLETSLPANNKAITPGSAVIIKRVGATNLTLVSSGTVKTTSTQVDIYEGFNFVGATKASNGTLGNYDFATQINLWDGISSEYDELQILDLNQVSEPYAAVEDVGPVMWSISASDFATSVSVEPGSGIFFKRVGNPNSTITLPGTTVAP